MSNEGILSILNFGLQNADRLSLGRGLSVRKSEMVGVLIFGWGCLRLESVFVFEINGKKGCDEVYFLLCKMFFIIPTSLDLFPGAFFESRNQG
jgi:hypothetical protein